MVPPMIGPDGGFAFQGWVEAIKKGDAAAPPFDCVESNVPYFFSAATPGSSLPSSHSRKAPPAADT